MAYFQDISLVRDEDGGLDCILDLDNGQRLFVEDRDAVVQRLDRRFSTPVNSWIGGPRFGHRLQEVINGPKEIVDRFARFEITRVLTAEAFLVPYSWRVNPTVDGARATAQLLDGSPVHFEFTLNKDAS
jgi:hypothetical protein